MACNITRSKFNQEKIDETVESPVKPSTIPIKTNGECNGVTKGEAKEEKEGWFHFKTKLLWPNIIRTTILHVGFVYAILTISFTQNLRTLLWTIVLAWVAGIGTTGGAHRLWAHRAYKAKWPLRVILMLAFYSAGQKSIYDWARDHRLHHKYTETDADPHNSKRGFFFTHVGWLMMKKHPKVLEKGRLIDMSDILADPVVRYGDRYFFPLTLLCNVVIPILIPVYFFDETWTRAVLFQVFIRYVYSLNVTWSVNSFAHMWGSKPYDKEIAPVENLAVGILAYGEGWHNYHHVFPWDYKASELGGYSTNATTAVIDMFSKIGWAYDLKEPTKDCIKMVIQNRGDGTHSIWSEGPEPGIKSL